LACRGNGCPIVDLLRDRIATILATALEGSARRCPGMEMPRRDFFGEAGRGLRQVNDLRCDRQELGIPFAAVMRTLFCAASLVACAPVLLRNPFRSMMLANQAGHSRRAERRRSGRGSVHILFSGGDAESARINSASAKRYGLPVQSYRLRSLLGPAQFWSRRPVVSLLRRPYLLDCFLSR
jgi:hypothetical protein